MSIEKPPRGGTTPENMVSYSEQLLALSISRLTGLLAACDPLTPACGKELTEEFRSLRKALEIAYHERAQIQKLKGGEQAAGATLDLDAARAEIAGRLARLRAAAGGGGVSGQPE
jgi:Xaa-Pro aminopeptidase